MEAALRRHLGATWAGTRWQRWTRRGWTDLRRAPLREGSCVLSAWNPRSHRRTLPENLRRDRLLLAVLLRQGLDPVRSRGLGRGWREDGWWFHGRPQLAQVLLRRFDQWAGLTQLGGRLHLLWRDGRSERWRPGTGCALPALPSRTAS